MPEALLLRAWRTLVIEAEAYRRSPAAHSGYEPVFYKQTRASLVFPFRGIGAFQEPIREGGNTMLKPLGPSCLPFISYHSRGHARRRSTVAQCRRSPVVISHATRI